MERSNHIIKFSVTISGTRSVCDTYSSTYEMRLPKNVDLNLTRLLALTSDLQGIQEERGINQTPQRGDY